MVSPKKFSSNYIRRVVAESVGLLALTAACVFVWGENGLVFLFVGTLLLVITRKIFPPESAWCPKCKIVMEDEFRDKGDKRHLTLRCPGCGFEHVGFGAPHALMFEDDADKNTKPIISLERKKNKNS